MDTHTTQDDRRTTFGGGHTATPTGPLAGVPADAGRADRLAEIARYDLANPGLLAHLDAAATRAVTALAAGSSLISVMLGTAARVLAAAGPVTEVVGPPAADLCARVVEIGVHSVVDRSHGCLGVPLRSPRGHVLGAFCVVGTGPREFSDAELDWLSGAADDAATVLQFYRDDR
ncbi:GAF domain-containing protein [Actinokineospora globicatena]|uniref:GAF domain-containing protein n=1 Tax=Actinokineospora globicatena TaxID=103729 RepID=UPI0020A5BB7D|nr:GAF domain-containing protein [Actinokineospora globicatena]MCP2300407.1 GAF domain-containing protein [Actinokineospora globicatena]GLW80940.1 hypothetical protein Aglo01_54210 [Actinokineospora globicatena]GLW88133.1 hypothetical protein Aglo02_57720 [Actinokineospora globicatena]